MAFSILALNPGSTSTKVARYEDDVLLWQDTLRHTPEELAPFGSVIGQFEFRKKMVLDALREHDGDAVTLHAVVGRGGIIDPIPGGTYRVDPNLVERLKLGKPWEHASNLGGVLAYALAEPRSIPAFIVDPVSVDEMLPEAKVMGLPGLSKPSFLHALNVKATVRLAARDLERPWDSLNCVVVHLGGGISVVAHRKGRAVDVNSANECGPFSLERAGGLPAGSLARLCFSGRYSEPDMIRRLNGGAGMKAYLGTTDMREVRRRIDEGDEKASLIYRTMVWQISKEIGAQAVAMGEPVDAILFTGGIAYDSDFVRLIQERVQWIAPCLVYPGEDEMSALTQGALRVLRGEEEAKNYAENVLSS
ncbi:MAG: butyrate kinase [Fretibacterium sp.]|nr:butyrate kinase [Fretibacterium sp.]